MQKCKLKAKILSTRIVNMDNSKTLNLNVRKDFPILSKKILEKKDLIYFDTAASAQKPNTVINETNDFYKNHYSNVSRGVHTLSVESTFRSVSYTHLTLPTIYSV